ncbi:MAG TPA: acyl carrier protein [Sphingomicrobium sp.]|nr:acyl carrier protein [Sphingomicrobium sp.]
MDRTEIMSRVTEQMRDVFDEPELVATDETSADDVADWDSTNHVRLIVAIEEDFGIRFETDEVTAPENVGELVDLIAAKV